MKKKGPPKVLLMGRYMVMNPKVCHGKPVFVGTRVMVADVLDQIANGMAWETVIEQWEGSITKEAIREAVELSKKALMAHKEEFIPIIDSEAGPEAA
jgi:uncharacterized protein (DUF433 family)